VSSRETSIRLRFTEEALRRYQKNAIPNRRRQPEPPSEIPETGRKPLTETQEPRRISPKMSVTPMSRKTTLIVGAILLAIGYYMQAAKIVRQETRFREVRSTESTKGRNAAIGGGVGAVAGGGTAAAIGGVGITFCGTGVGLPAGVLIIGLAALVGGGAGATIGAATGKTETVINQVPYTVSIVEPAYSHDVSLAVITLGSVIIIWVLGSYWKEKAKSRANPVA